MPEQSNMMSTSEAAEILGMTTRRVVGLCHEEKLEGAVQNGRNWTIPESSVLKLRESNDLRGWGPAAGKTLRPCAIGNTSFAEIASDCYYVDKTLMIRDLVDDRNQVILFTRPRRFGKTLAIDTLKTFFEKTEKDTARLFRDKKIWKCGNRYRELQGKYPVIHLSFKDVKYGNWQDSMDAIRLVLKDELLRHHELETGNALNGDEKDYLEKMTKGRLSDVECSRALLDLTRILAKHHGTQVVVLIDEYDTPIQQGYFKGFYQEIIAFMRNFFSAGLKDNPDLAFGVLTGITRVSKENLFSGMNNLAVNTVADEKYSEYFGFTDEEVADMAVYYGRRDSMAEIRKWYDGYRFGNKEIYNPWSVTNYFSNSGTAKPYWVNTSDNAIIREILQELTPEIADQLTLIMQEEKIHAMINTEVVYPRITDGADMIFSFLLMAGYLTLESSPEETEFGTIATLRLPNLEIRRVYTTEILGWMRTKTADSVISEIEKAIWFSDGERLQKALRGYLISCVSAFDGAAEGFYHGMMLGLVAGFSSRYYIRSNRESGEGRYDLQMEPKGKDLPGILMEFKTGAAPEKDKLAALAEEAVSQIGRRRYAQEMEERGIGKIIYYGIAFSGKNVEVKTLAARPKNR